MGKGSRFLITGVCALAAVGLALAVALTAPLPASVAAQNAAIPGVALTAPAEGTVVRGAITLAAEASAGGSAVASVAFAYSADDGASWTAIGNALAAPYRWGWDPAALPAGSYLVRAVAQDGAGNEAGDTVGVMLRVGGAVLGTREAADGTRGLAGGCVLL